MGSDHARDARNALVETNKIGGRERDEGGMSIPERRDSPRHDSFLYEMAAL
jgi:hypothetical protein